MARSRLYDTRLLKSWIFENVFGGEHDWKRTTLKHRLNEENVLLSDISCATKRLSHDDNVNWFWGSVRNSEFLTEPQKLWLLHAYATHPSPPVQCWITSLKMMISECSFDDRTSQHWTGGAGCPSMMMNISGMMHTFQKSDIVSTPIFCDQIKIFSIFRDLHDVHTLAPLRLL